MSTPGLCFSKLNIPGPFSKIGVFASNYSFDSIERRNKNLFQCENWPKDGGAHYLKENVSLFNSLIWPVFFRGAPLALKKI